MLARGALRGLDWLFFFVADLQTVFGPFVAVYLTHNRWTQSELGIALGVGTGAAMLAQLPAGLLVDSLRDKALAAAIALVGVWASAVLMASSPSLLPVLAAQIICGFASCMLTPALAALTLRLVSRPAVAERLGRNARFAAIGNAIGAAMMGACATFISTRATFALAALLCVPALFVLWRLRGRVREPAVVLALRAATEAIRGVLLDRRLIAYVGCAMLFHLANAAMLPLAGGEITRRVDQRAGLIVAACILLPQFLVAALSPLAGRAANRWGRRSVLLAGFCALPARALLLAFVTTPAWIVPVQALDGLGGAAFGVITPLVAADISGPNGRFNLRMGIVGLGIGLAATISNTVAGAIATNLGNSTAFMALALAGMAAVVAVGFGMPETRPEGRAVG
jgi:MFS family permease